MNAKMQFKRFDFLDNLEVLVAEDYRHDFPNHIHDQVCVTLVQKGFECTEVNGQQLLSPVGKISLTYSDEVHANPNLNEDDYSFITFYLSPDFIKHQYRQKHFGFSDRVLDDPNIYKELYHWALLPTSEQSVAKIQGILSKLFQNYFIPEQEKEEQLTTFSEILDYLEMNLSEKISLEQLAFMAGQSKFSFLRMFKKNKGITPANYLVLRRLEAAKRMLKAGASLVDTTYACGFFDQSHFCKYFKKYHGLTPQQYQQAAIFYKTKVC